MCGVVDLNNKGLMLVGGFRLEKDGSVGNIWERYVFDWEGNLKKRISLDKYINVFVIDTANDILYGMNTNQANILYYHYFKD